MKPSHSYSTSVRRKLHRRFTPFVFSFYMAAIMALLMCMTIVAVQIGFDSGYWLHVANTYVVAMPVAFFCVLIIRPIVMRLVALTVDV